MNKENILERSHFQEQIMKENRIKSNLDSFETRETMKVDYSNQVST